MNDQMLSAQINYLWFMRVLKADYKMYSLLWLLIIIVICIGLVFVLIF